MHELTEGHHSDRLTNRAAGGLLIAFLTAVILVLTVANTIPATADDAYTGGHHHQTAVSR